MVKLSIYLNRRVFIMVYFCTPQFYILGESVCMYVCVVGHGGGVVVCVGYLIYAT